LYYLLYEFRRQVTDMKALKKISFAFLSLWALAPGDAAAVPNEGACCRRTPHWYAGVSGSLSYLEDMQFKEDSRPAGFIPLPDLSFKQGFGFGLDVGYRFFPWLRTEGEVFHRTNDLEAIANVPITIASDMHSEQTTLAYMANVYLDYDNNSRWTPYLGAGAGVVHIKNPTKYTITDGSNVETIFFKDWANAYQFMTGVSYLLPFNKATPIQVNFGYRYFMSDYGESTSSVFPGYTIKFNDKSHNFEVGARMYF
jgi:OOP family OmpA-OmpF porin